MHHAPNSRGRLSLTSMARIRTAARTIQSAGGHGAWWLGGINEHCARIVIVTGGALTRLGDDSNGRRGFTRGRVGRASRREDDGGGAGERTERKQGRGAEAGGRRGAKGWSHVTRHVSLIRTGRGWRATCYKHLDFIPRI
jgi:hypothetical protein